MKSNTRGTSNKVRWDKLKVTSKQIELSRKIAQDALAGIKKSKQA